MALKGILEGKISEEDCKRLGMTEDEINDFVNKIKEGKEVDVKHLDTLRRSVMTFHSTKQDNEKARLREEILNLQEMKEAHEFDMMNPGSKTFMRITDQDEGLYMEKAEEALTGHASANELKKLIQEFAGQLAVKQATIQ